MTSSWEDPGFVLIEAALCRTFVISSNCNNGPTEFLDNNKAEQIWTKTSLNQRLFEGTAIGIFSK